LELIFLLLIPMPHFVLFLFLYILHTLTNQPDTSTNAPTNAPTDVPSSNPTPSSSSAVGNWTEMFIPYADDLNSCDYTPPLPTYGIGDVCRQHLHIAIPDKEGPHPIFLWAHAAGDNADLDEFALGRLTAPGYAVISWESLTGVGGEEGAKQGERDLKRVVEWIKNHRAEYGLDLSQTIVGGRSRGSILSWKLAHKTIDNIKGIYMYNALPNGAWENGADVWTDRITNRSAPIVLVYGPACPHPIGPNCTEPKPNPLDGHNPRNGATIVQRYDELSLDSFMVDGLHLRDKKNIFQYFPAFVEALQTGTFPESMPIPIPEDIYSVTP